MTLVEIDHRLTYRYDRPVTLLPQLVRLRPRLATKYEHELTISPAAHVGWRLVARDHMTAVVTLYGETTEFRIASRFTAYVCDSKPQGVGSLMDVCRGVHCAVRYVDRSSEGVQEPGETLERGTGTCRDLAWLLVRMLREKKLDARFVSGYFVNLPMMSVELHAWAETFDRGEWVGLDPTMNVVAGGCHIPLASARHYRDASPVSGTVTPEVDGELSWELSCRSVEIPAVS